MALNLVGLEPGADRSYMWIGDSAIDIAKSDVAKWISTGEGLVELPDAKATRFRVQALRPTTLQIVYNQAALSAPQHAGPEPVDGLAASLANMPAVYLAAIAYAVVGIDEGMPLKRVTDAGGLRLADDVLRKLEHFVADIEIEGEKHTIRMITHLGSLILGDSQASEREKKV